MWSPLQLLGISLACAGLARCPQWEFPSFLACISPSLYKEPFMEQESDCSSPSFSLQLACPEQGCVRRGAGNVGSVREPGPLPRAGGFQQPQASRLSSFSSELQLAAVQRGGEPAVKYFGQPRPLFPWPSPWLSEPAWSRAGISGCFPKGRAQEASPWH